jgi:hypothetical protein
MPSRASRPWALDATGANASERWCADRGPEERSPRLSVLLGPGTCRLVRRRCDRQQPCGTGPARPGGTWETASAGTS